MTQLLEADLTWTGERFEPGVRVAIGEDGRLAEVDKDLRGDVRRFAGRALLPGLVSAHSHAFQRGLRGHGERFPAGAGSFWTWREALYALVDRLDADTLHALSLAAFREMLAAGITTVGEFHYLHHGATNMGWELDAAVLRAARDAGIRIALLSAYYATGGIGEPLAGAQLRFRSRHTDDYWEGMERAQAACEGDTQTLGCAVHSLRAASLDDLQSVHAEARRRGLVVHMSVEEQRRETEDCVAVYGRTPTRVLLDELELDGGFTAVHATHTAPDDLAEFLATGARVCVCPTTEASLGDGTCDLAGVLARPDALSIGTDSNARISMVEELRWLEYAQRLVGKRRGVARDPHDAGGEVARPVFRAATLGGAEALGLRTGALTAGAFADLVALDLASPSLDGWTPETLLESWIFGAGDECVAEVAVGGRWVR